ncbi:MAG: F0F1 ATP synthase subunit gamma [Gammaproteobacteria bacterium AqS3]|nr:F0F1 ATP synthase subunit gamma [Gammaproteobacteria bacterium AqS3]
MSNIKEVRKQIGSIQSTQKITRAMEMVAASKMRKTQQRMSDGRPYSDALRRIIRHLAAAQAEYRSEYMQVREVRRAAFLIVSTDKGLCGGLNINLFRRVVQRMREQDEAGVEVVTMLLGAKAEAFFRNSEVLSSASRLGEAPSIEALLGALHAGLSAYRAGEIDSIHLCGNHFVNTMTQTPYCEQLLPLPLEAGVDAAERPGHWDYIYEPEASEILDALVPRYIEALVYQAVIENGACEQAAKMLAMKNASENAGNLIDDLQLLYNNARQAAITQELSEIVGGAAAV